MGPVAYTRIAEIMSGRSHLQQRQAATRKDLLYKENPKEEGGVGIGAWARMSDEGGVMTSEVIGEITLVSGNTRTGQRGSGHSVASTTEIVSGRRAGLHEAKLTERGTW